MSQSIQAQNTYHVGKKWRLPKWEQRGYLFRDAMQGNQSPSLALARDPETGREVGKVYREKRGTERIKNVSGMLWLEVVGMKRYVD